MSFDFAGALGASRRLSSQNADLSTLKKALRQARGDLQSSWSGPDRNQVDSAIVKIIEKIDRTQRLIDGACHDMNAGAAKLKTLEDTERAERALRLKKGGGGGGW